MEVLISHLESVDFKNNVMTLIKRLNIELPTDTIVLHCERCFTNIPLCTNGILHIESKLLTCINDAAQKHIQKAKEIHQMHCSENIIVHPKFGLPDNLLVLLPSSTTVSVEDITVWEEKFIPELIVKCESGKNILFALYHKDGVMDTTYHDLICENFETFLNVDESEGNLFEETEVVFDDESVHEHQQAIPRVYGGGRRIIAPYNYECQWCPKEVLESGKGGRFLEIKNYRDHFRNKHMSTGTGGIMMSEFTEKVNRREPTWVCKNCKRRIVFANMLRHKAACYDINDENQDFQKLVTAKKDFRKKKTMLSNTFEDDSSSDESIVHRSSLPPRKLDSSTDEDEPQDQDTGRDPEKRENNNQIKSNTKRVKVADECQPVTLPPLRDEIDISSLGESDMNKDIEIKFEVKEEFIDDNEAGTSSGYSNLFEKSKWWLKMETDNLLASTDGGPNIFYKDDTDRFKTIAIENWKKHISARKELDKQMIEAESSEAKSRLYSFSRDQPFLKKYTEYVSSFSAKDILGIFTEDYASMETPKGAKSSTAGQYGNRIIEFFKYMASKYPDYHLDWMVDFDGSIEKIYPNGSRTNDIFLPKMDDLREFIQSFKYGSNPAANCGLRIFALKKMLEFLKQEVKDNEHVFKGSIVDKSNTVEALAQKIDRLNEGICPDGTIKHLATASNRSHKRSLIEQMAKCPSRNMESIMKGVGEYVQSEEYNIQRTKLIELSCKKAKLPTSTEYMNSTNWLLEQLICLGGNRPCALLGITLRDWTERKPGFCPFNTEEDSETFQEDPKNDARKVLKDPYSKPKGEKSETPTGYIVSTETDKIAVSANQPCYIWFPNAIVDLINDHSLMAQKVVPKSVDIYHPKTNLFLNSMGKPITRIECKHFKRYIGLPITSYDFRRSLSTFCLDSDIEAVRNSESSILRHREETGYAYYYQKHGEKVEYVSIQYAKNHGLIKASVQAVDEYCASLRTKALNDGWNLTQKRADRAIDYHQSILDKRKQGLQNARQKGERNWILPKEYDDFLGGINEALRIEKQRIVDEEKPGPFQNLLKYESGHKDAGLFPPTKIWQVDMLRVLYGLDGEIGDEMRKAELSVYNGIPFSSGLNGRKKIATELSLTDKSKGPIKKTEDWVVANYWRDKIRRQTAKLYAGKWARLPFIFNIDEFNYNLKMDGKK